MVALGIVDAASSYILALRVPKAVGSRTKIVIHLSDPSAESKMRTHTS